MTKVQIFQSGANTHNFNIIDVQLFLGLLLGCEFRLLNIIVVGMGLQ